MSDGSAPHNHTPRERPLSRLAKAALKYAEFGWRVFPCEPQGKTPLDPCDECLERLPSWTGDAKGKRDKVCRHCGTVHEEKNKQRGCHLGTTDPKLIERWWRFYPDANIGIATGGYGPGSPGLLVLDVDGPKGEATLAELTAQHGPLPATPVQTTSRGRHYVFQVTQAVPNSAGTVGAHPNPQGKSAPSGIDTRGDGGYIVAAPSVHPNGTRYEWSADARPSAIPLAPAPKWLLEALAKPQPKPRPAPPPGEAAAPVADRYVRRALEDECRAVSTCPQGGRNKTLNKAAYSLGTMVGAGMLSESAVRHGLEQAAIACGLPKSEYLSTIASGLAAGIANPRQPPPPPSPTTPSGAPRGRRPSAAVSHAIQVATVDGQPTTDPTAVLHTRGSVWLKGEPPDFLTNSEGVKLKNSLHNILLHLRGEAQLAQLFALDELSRHVLVTRATPWPGPPTPRLYSDADITALCAYLEQHQLTPKFDTIKRAIGLCARENMINPIRDRLQSFTWDGVARLDHWTVDYLGAPDTSFSRQAGSRWLISACARILRPGCKVDTMLVLEGPQGARKSSALSAIASALSDHCFTDRLSKLDGKDAVIELQGNVIVEIAELDAFRGSQVSTIKAFLSRQTDKIRLPWDATITELPRACVFAGTVNPGGAGWLHDATGARRFWPLAVSHIDIEGLVLAAPHLWAEALVRYHNGEQWWITDAVVLAEAEAAVSARYEEDVWATDIDDYVRGKTKVTASEVLQHLGFELSRRDQKASQRVGDHLRRRGWKRSTVRLAGKPVMGFAKDNPDPNSGPSGTDDDDRGSE